MYNMHQEYEKYTQDDQDVWELLYNRQMEQLPHLADPTYLDAIKSIGFQSNKIPNYDDLNAHLRSKTGWEIAVVPGLIPNKPFYELLLDKKFPASTWLRKRDELDYLEEPDMFHDIFGHIPLLTNEDFVSFLKNFGRVALKYLHDPWGVEMIARIYWYTVEFGLINTNQGTKIYGAGILSSYGESIYSVSDEMKKNHRPYNVREIVHTPYIKDRFQSFYYVIDSYRQLFESIDEIDQVLSEEIKKNSSKAA